MHASSKKKSHKGQPDVQVSGPNSVARSARKLAKKRKNQTAHYTKMPLDVKKNKLRCSAVHVPSWQSSSVHATIHSTKRPFLKATAYSFSGLLSSSSSTGTDGDCELMRTHEDSLTILHQELDNLIFPRRVRHLPTQTLRPHYRWRKHNRNVHARHQILALTLHNPL
jgi:hypothetical protein